MFVAHGLIIHGWALQRAHMSLHWMAWMATSNLVGAAIYAARVRRPHGNSSTRTLISHRFLKDGFLTSLMFSVQATKYFTWQSSLLRLYICAAYSKHSR